MKGPNPDCQLVSQNIPEHIEIQHRIDTGTCQLAASSVRLLLDLICFDS